MLRLTNPYNAILERSVIFVDVMSAKTPRPYDGISDSFAENGGLVKTVSQGSSINSIFSISHGRVDGYGLLTQLSKEFESFEYLESFERREGFIDGYDYVQLITQRTRKVSGERTFTQDFVEAFVARFERLKAEELGFVINLETEQISDQPWGNGIVIPTIAGEKLRALAALPKDGWREALNRLAVRTLSILQKRPQLAATLDSVVISSLGQVGEKYGASKITAQNAIISATPIFPSSVNLFLYCDQEVQSLVVCGKKDHWLFSQLSSIEEIWKPLC